MKRWERKEETRRFEEAVSAVHSQLRELKQRTRVQPDSSERLSKGSYDSQLEKKRKEVYESHKEDPLNESTIEANNQLFSMVFLSKDSVSTSSSFSKLKNGPQITDFALGRKLGAGKFGEVFVARHKKTGLVFAIKRIEKRQMDPKMKVQLARQVKIQSFLQHVNIVRLYCFFADESFLYLVEELCYSSQLYDFMRARKKLPEGLTKNIIKQVCQALAYMHDSQIIHRDLKPQNILYTDELVKICDFGWSIYSKQMRETFCGTPLYISPQLLEQKNYDNKIDVWSIGILTYQLLFGKVPFDINSKRDFVKIVEDEIRFSHITPISAHAKNFIIMCLMKDPRERLSVAELLEHPFVLQQELMRADMC